MEKIFFDTTFLIHYYRKKSEVEELLTKFKKKDLCISNVSYAEFVATSKLRTKADARKLIRHFKLLPFSDKFNQVIETLSAKYEVDKKNIPDFLIACEAIAHKALLVTNNKKHFEKYKELHTHFYSVN